MTDLIERSKAIAALQSIYNDCESESIQRYIMASAIAAIRALPSARDDAVTHDAIAAFVRQQGYVRLDITLDKTGGYDATYYPADAFDA